MRYLVSLAWTLLVITVAMGCHQRNKKPPRILTDEEFNKLIINQFEDKNYVSRRKQINPGAKVPIYMIPTSAELMKEGDFDLYPIIGLFHYQGDDKAIWVVGDWHDEMAIILHEYQHYLEHCVPDRKKELRAAFRAIDTPELHIGYADLMEELP